MPSYKAPLEDVRFLLTDVFQIDRYNNLAGFSDAAAARNRELKRFLFAHIYNHVAIAEDRDLSVKCLEELGVLDDVRSAGAVEFRPSSAQALDR